MNYFEDWYTQPIDNEEEDRERRWALMLQAAADAGGLHYEPQEDSNFTSDHASFNPRTGTDLIQQILNRNVTDMNLGFGDAKDLPSTTDLFGRPAEAVDPLDFFDRKAPVNPLLDLAGSTAPNDDFWQGLQKGSGLVAQTQSGDADGERKQAQDTSVHPAADRNSYNQYEDVLDRTTGAGGISLDPGSYLVYKDGQLSVHDDNDNEYMRIPASSGEPGVTDPTLKGKGPIPPGTYWFDPREISPSGFIRRHIDPRDWGEYRVRLYSTADTDTYGQTNFFLHGGEKPGSAGCIDIGNADRDLFPLLTKLRGPIYIKVK